MRPKQNIFADRRSQFSTGFFRPQQFLNGNLVNSRQFHNLRPPRQIAGAFPIHQGCPGNSTALGDFILRQFFFRPQEVQPSTIRITTSFWFPTHAAVRISTEIGQSSVLTIHRQNKIILGLPFDKKWSA